MIILRNSFKNASVGSSHKDNIYVSIFIFVSYFCIMIDTALHQGRRRKMTKGLTAKNTYNENVISAMSVVPRHAFVSAGLDNMAYEEKPLAIACGQTISQPSTVALQSHLLGEVKGKKILEIGTGCGYQTAVLLQMGAEVYTIERHKELCLVANSNLKKCGYDKAHLFLGDGHKGLAQFAPFDAIIVTCCAAAVPQGLTSQLATGGKMAIPVERENGEQMMVVIKRVSEEVFEEEEIGKCSFVPMLEGVVK